jgi:REP element-mobilizing transposase RayT
MRVGLFSYIGGMLRARRGRLLAGGGWTDHIHLYIDLPAGVSVATLISEIKCASTGWLRRTFPEDRFVGWQRSYAAFSVDRRRDQRLRRYIQRQDTIHHRRSLRQETSALYLAYGVADPEDLGD